MTAALPYRRKEVIGDCTLYLGDCRDILPTLGKVDHVISDPPYEALMQNKWGVLSAVDRGSKEQKKLVRHETLGFEAIDEMRDDVAVASVKACDGWAIFFCMAEGVRAWRDSIEKAGARYKRALVWIKPDAMPQFNGQGPSVGHEMMVSAWCGKGHSKWNGGGRPGTFIHTKNTQGAVHPTQKPLPLMLELVSLFSFDGDLVCDPFMGSATTAVACIKLGRSFVGIEANENHFKASCDRIRKAYAQPDMFIAPPVEKPKQEALEL